MVPKGKLTTVKLMKKHCVTILMAGLSLALLGCQAERVTPESPAPSTQVALMPVSSSPREAVAKVLVQALKQPSFQTALFEGVSLMRDGDNEVLFAEMVYPSRTRGNDWQTALQEGLTEALEGASSRTRGGANALEDFFASRLADDPLMQVLMVAPNGMDLSREMLADPSLHVVVLPENFDDSKAWKLLAYDRQGRVDTVRSDVQPDFPVLVVGKNERVEPVPTGVALPDGATLYHRGDDISYTSTYEPYRNSHDDDDEGEGEGRRKKWDRYHKAPLEPDDDWTAPPAPPKNQDPQKPKPSKPGRPTERAKWGSAPDYLLKAGFSNQDALRKYEPYVKGRPEMRCVIATGNLGDMDLKFSDKGWWNGSKKWLGNRLFQWALLAAPGDYYSVQWIEEDGGVLDDFTLSFTYKGITGKVGFKLRDDDDVIGKKPVHYTEPALFDGYCYDLGDFQFWIGVRD